MNYIDLLLGITMFIGIFTLTSPVILRWCKRQLRAAKRQE